MNDKIEIKPYEYNSYCEIAGCRNLGKKTISKPVALASQKIIVCDNCIAEIVEAAPKEVILKLISENKELQKDISNILDEEVIINRALELTKDAAENEGVTDIIKGDEDVRVIKKGSGKRTDK